MTEEHKKKIQEGRKKAREERLAKGLPLRNPKGTVTFRPSKYRNDKPILIYDGTEKNVFDFWKRLRNVFRPLHLYTNCKDIEKAIYDPTYYQNIPWILERLEKYVSLEYVPIDPPPKKVKKERKKRDYTITPEHVAKMQAARVAKKNAKLNN